jgi:uncharacterized protein (TIGR02118 family)
MAMIRMMVSYPNKPGARFDVDYYLNNHCPMVMNRLGPYGMKSWSVDQGMAGFAPGSPAEYLIQAHINFEILEGLQAGMAAEAPGILADIPNYTDLQPQIQINQILR